ncbi:unnamed protein product, partial [marine sediment metagenome]
LLSGYFYQKNKASDEIFPVKIACPVLDYAFIIWL